jgi:hypothetical protein
MEGSKCILGMQNMYSGAKRLVDAASLHSGSPALQTSVLQFSELPPHNQPHHSIVTMGC